MTHTDVRHVREAGVWVDGTQVATLTRGEGGTDFAYLPEALAAGVDPVATTLPLDERPVRTVGGALPPFFAGLLPEGRRLTALRTRVKTSADDELSLLLAVGADVVGNVQVLPGGVGPREASMPIELAEGPGTAGPEEWAETDFAELAARAGVDPAALAGVQDKVSGRMLTLPLMAGGQFHLLKLNLPEYPGVVENEAFFLDLARRMRQPVVDARVVRDRERRTGLLVTRFDRRLEGGLARRLAVEDGAQLLGRYPADKYAVTTEELVRRFSEVAGAPLPAVRSALGQVLFAWLTGNGDLHAKNLSLVRREGEWWPSPIYDIPSTLPYRDHRMALTVAGRDDSLSLKRWSALASEMGLAARAADRLLAEVLAATADLDDRLAGLPVDERTRRDMRGVLGRRRALLGG